MKSNETTEQPQRTMVQATQPGFYRNVYCDRGMTFALTSASDFTPRWMVKVSADAPDQIKAPDPRRVARPGERPATSVLTPLPAPVKPGDAITMTNTPTGDLAVI